MRVRDILDLKYGLEYLEPNDSEFMQGVGLYRRQCCSMSLHEFLQKIKEVKSTPVWLLGEDYMALVSSINFINKLLKFQFPKKDDRTKFITDVFNWINLTYKKKSLFVLVGEANCGE